ncbi:MAG: hypothetical protein JEY97_00710 [Bacteroidales bacterium]|nr:hypothetical protein [Bacteroidales bacterium]
MFKGRSIKWLLISMILLSGISFGFSKIQLIDYKKINEGLFRKSIHYKYNLELPESDVYQRIEKKSLIEDIFIVTSKENPNNSEPIIVINNKKVAFADLPGKIKEIQLSKDEIDAKFIIFFLHIHRDIKMSFINKLRKQLMDIGIWKVTYDVTPCNPKFDSRYYGDLGLSLRLPKLQSDSLDFQEIFEKYHKGRDIIKIKPLESGFCLFNETLIESKDLKEKYKNQMIENQNNIVKFYHNKNLDFSAYIRIISDLLVVVHELRDMYSINKYLKSYDMLSNYEEREMIRKKYPLLIFEMKD